MRLVRSLIELGRFDAAREKVKAALDRHEAEPLLPFYVDTLELALARAEAGGGHVEQAVERARRCVERVEERGVCGVALVGFLVEAAILFHGAGDRARFEALTARVGALVSGVDSTALATQYARLLSMRRSAKFEVVAAPLGHAEVATAYTAVASNVRTELERCHGPAERSLQALRFLLTYSGAARGFLYLYREELELAAAIPEGEPTEALDDEVRGWVSATFEREAVTATAVHSDAPISLSSSSASSAFRFVELVNAAEGEAVLVGVAALEPPRAALARVPEDVLRTVSQELVRSGDARGKAIQ